MAASEQERELAATLRGAGISESYASLLARGIRSPSAPLAIDIYRKTGVKLVPISEATEEDIDALERVVGRGKARQPKAA